MRKTISNRQKWRDVLSRRQRANARHWLKRIQSSENRSAVVAENYGNLLRAVETTLEDTKMFDLAYRLLQALHDDTTLYADSGRWLAYLRRALAVSNELGLIAKETRLFELTGTVLFHVGDLDSAHEHCRRALTQYHELNDIASKARTMAVIAVILDGMGRTVEGYELCKKSIGLASTVGDKHVEAYANLNLSHIYIRATEHRRALDAAQQAYKTYLTLGKLEFATRALVNMVACWSVLGEWTWIDAVAKELEVHIAAVKDEYKLSLLKNSLGIAAFNQGQYLKAESLWQEALVLHSRLNEPAEFANLCNNLGKVYTELKNWTAAKTMLDKAIQLYDLHGDVYGWANAQDNLADLHVAQGELLACRRTLNEILGHSDLIEAVPHGAALLHQVSARLATLPDTIPF